MRRTRAGSARPRWRIWWGRMVSLNLTSWNQLAVWLRQVERVQSAA